MLTRISIFYLIFSSVNGTQTMFHWYPPGQYYFQSLNIWDAAGNGNFYYPLQNTVPFQSHNLTLYSQGDTVPPTLYNITSIIVQQ